MFARSRFTAAENLGAMDIPCGQILQRSTTRVFVLDMGLAWNGPVGSVGCRRRTWILNFSSALRTYSSAQSG
jgi:hypothetical protein